MNNPLMSQFTVELMLLLCDDGVEHEELKALVDSAFKDGMASRAEHEGEPGQNG